MIRRIGVAGDRGFTLVELLVYSVLLVLVLGIVGSILVSAITGQRRASDAAQTSQEAQLVMTSIGSAVRSATHVNAPTGTSPLLVIEGPDRSASGVSVCQAWLYSETDASLRTLIRTVGAAKMTAAEVRTSGTLLASKVRAVASGTPVLQATPSTRSVTVALSVRTDRARQTLESTFTSRQPAPTTGSACF